MGCRLSQAGYLQQQLGTNRKHLFLWLSSLSVLYIVLCESHSCSAPCFLRMYRYGGLPSAALEATCSANPCMLYCWCHDLLLVLAVALHIAALDVASACCSMVFRVQSCVFGFVFSCCLVSVDTFTCDGCHLQTGSGSINAFYHVSYLFRTDSGHDTDSGAFSLLL